MHVNAYIDTGPAEFAGNQPAWTNSLHTGNNGFPDGLAKSIGIAVDDFPLGRVGGHTPLSGYLAAQWTAPMDGVVDISGGVWMWRDIGRTNVVNLFNNGVGIISDVLIPHRSAGVTSSNTFTLSDAITAGGGSPSSLMGINVHAGDKLTLAVYGLASEDFVGMDYTIHLRSVPEPSSIAMAIFGVACLACCKISKSLK